MHRVIVNSTPIILLSNINQLDILKQIYGEIIIPQAVYNEVTADDNSAKKTAKFLNLSVTGTLGVLLKAKKLKIINEVKPLIDALLANGFFVTQKVYDMVLEQTSENKK